MDESLKLFYAQLARYDQMKTLVEEGLKNLPTDELGGIFRRMEALSDGATLDEVIEDRSLTGLLMTRYSATISAPNTKLVCGTDRLTSVSAAVRQCVAKARATHPRLKYQVVVVEYDGAQVVCQFKLRMTEALRIADNPSGAN